LPERLFLLGRDFGMISFRRRQDSLQSPQDNNKLPRVMRTLLCGLRSRRRPRKVLDRVPREGKTTSGGGHERDMSTVRLFACGEMGQYAGQCPKKKKK
jgi:hypothetical protein